jgi:hypothetical protein
MGVEIVSEVNKIYKVIPAIPFRYRRHLAIFSNFLLPSPEMADV